jgi:hypothetical protein
MGDDLTGKVPRKPITGLKQGFIADKVWRK